MARRASARATSRPFSRPSSGSRSGGATCEVALTAQARVRVVLAGPGRAYSGGESGQAARGRRQTADSSARLRTATMRPHYGTFGRMTQQDETGQSAATDQPVPSRPSPYLDASESAPQAYLAPPRPDQPRYGTPPAYRTGPRSGGSGQQPYAQPGPGQQPGDGRLGYARRG